MRCMLAGASLGLLLLACGVAHAVLGPVDKERPVRVLGAEESPVLDKSYVSTYEVVTTLPHDPNAFTQGLVFDAAGQLYESDGLYHKSAVRSVHVLSGSSDATHGQKLTKNLPSHFAEGIAVVHKHLLQLTWQERKVNYFALPSLELVQSVDLPCATSGDTQPHACREGWGFAYDGAQTLYLTDSTDQLFFLDSSTLKSKSPPLQIYDPVMKRPVHGVNELEWVEGELWGNVFPMYQGEASECIVRINATDATVIGWIDLRGLLDRQRDMVRRSSHNYVLNGIAYHADSGRLYVTGKQWDYMYQIRVKPGESNKQTSEYVKGACHLGRADGQRSSGRRD